METWADGLAALLGKEQELIDKLIGKANEKKEAIRSGNVRRLDEIVSGEKMLAEQLGDAEGKRLDLMKKHNLGGRSLGELAEQAGGETARRLTALLESMGASAAELRRLSGLNAELAKIRLDYYALAGRAAGSGALYNGQGKAGGGSGRGLIDRVI